MNLLSAQQAPSNSPAMHTDYSSTIWAGDNKWPLVGAAVCCWHEPQPAELCSQSCVHKVMQTGLMRTRSQHSQQARCDSCCSMSLAHLRSQAEHAGQADASQMGAAVSDLHQQPSTQLPADLLSTSTSFSGSCCCCCWMLNAGCCANPQAITVQHQHLQLLQPAASHPLLEPFLS